MVSDPRAKTAESRADGRRGRAPGARRPAAGAALGARARAVRRDSGRCRRATSPPARRSSSRSAGTWPRRSTCASSPTSSSSRRAATPTATRCAGSSRPPTSGSFPSTSTRPLPADTRWHPGRRPAAARLRPRADRARGTRAAPREALLHEHRLRARAGRRSRSPSYATSTAPRSATTSRRRTCSACSCAGTCSSRPATRRESGPGGGRPAALFGFRAPELEITDQFAVLRPPDGLRSSRRTSFQAPGSASAARYSLTRSPGTNG